MIRRGPWRTRKLLERSGLPLSTRVCHRITASLTNVLTLAAMHLETFLYMLLQSDKTLPPNNLNPDFEGMAENAKLNEGHDWIYVPEVHLERGLEDEENDDGPERFFGWDNEKPRRKIHVKAFESRPKVLTNGDYAMFLENTGKSEVGLWSHFGAIALVLIIADASLLDHWLPSWRSRGRLDDEWTL